MRIDSASIEKLEKFNGGYPNNTKAYDVTIRAFLIHSFMVEKAKDDETVDFMCCVHGREIVIGSVGPFLGDSLYIESRDEDKETVSFFTPINQVSFMYVVSPKKSDEPPREIGFHTTMERNKKE
jgi:hypothetical protein